MVPFANHLVFPISKAICKPYYHINKAILHHNNIAKYVVSSYRMVMLVIGSLKVIYEAYNDDELHQLMYLRSVSHTIKQENTGIT